jgi:hypothetical protein
MARASGHRPPQDFFLPRRLVFGVIPGMGPLFPWIPLCVCQQDTSVHRTGPQPTLAHSLVHRFPLRRCMRGWACEHQSGVARQAPHRAPRPQCHHRAKRISRRARISIRTAPKSTRTLLGDCEHPRSPGHVREPRPPEQNGGAALVSNKR